MSPILPGSPSWRGANALYVTRKLGLVSNCRLILDAGDAESYTSGEKWLDLSGLGTDFFLGADGTADAANPTFNGTAGRLTSAETWSFATDYFTYDAANETWMNNVHKDNFVGTFLFWGNPSTANRSFIGTHGGSASNIGFDFRITTTAPSPSLGFQVVNGSGTPALSITSGVALPGGVTLCGLSYDEASGGGFWFQGGTVIPISSSPYSSPSASDATFIMQIAARGNGGQAFASGNNLAIAQAWEGRALTAGEVLAYWNALRGRFGV